MKWNLTEGADLQINVSKAKVICLGGSRKNRAIKSVEKNLIELEMFPTRTKKLKRKLEVPNFQCTATKRKERY